MRNIFAGIIAFIYINYDPSRILLQLTAFPRHHHSRINDSMHASSRLKVIGRDRREVSLNYKRGVSYSLEMHEPSAVMTNLNI